MGSFNRGDRSGGRRDFGGGRRSFGGGGGRNFRRDDRGGRGGDRQMFSVVCSDCGKNCEVPFRPTGDKPVYCSNCFEKKGGGGERRSFDRPRRDDRSGGGDNLRTQIESLNAKLDKIIGLLEPKPAVLSVESVVVDGTKSVEPVKEEKKKRSSKKKEEEVADQAS